MLDPAPFYAPPHVKFRMAKLPEGECSASECSLICSKSNPSRLVVFLMSADDYWNSGYGRIIMVPRVKLAYDKASIYFHTAMACLHPRRKYTILYTRIDAILPLFGDTSVSVGSRMTRTPTRKIEAGMAHTIGSSPRRRMMR